MIRAWLSFNLGRLLHVKRLHRRRGNEDEAEHPGGGLSRLGGSPGGTSLKDAHWQRQDLRLPQGKRECTDVGDCDQIGGLACSTIFAPYMTKIRCEK